MARGEGREPRGSKVLLIDPSRADLIKMARALVGLPTDIHLAQSREMALGQLDAHEFSVIVMDAGKDGMSLAGAIRARPRGAVTPLIFVTGGERDETLRLGGYGLGAVDFLFKPIEPAVLRAKIEVFLQLDRQRQALEQTNQALADQRSELERLVRTDPITELLNRRGFEAALERALSEQPREDAVYPASVIMFGCDDFGEINERYGHGVGDEVLHTIAARLREVMRPGDSLARIGGDEFLALLPGTSIGVARELAERARARVSETPIIAADGAVSASVSAGVTTLPWDASALSQVLARTRPLLREVKALGKNRVIGARAPVSGSLVERLVRGDGLRVVGQSIVRLSDHEILGYELLTRGPDGPMAAPLGFLEFAREQHMLSEIDLQCLKICLAAASTLPAGTQAHVNLFPTTLLTVPQRELERLLEMCARVQVCLELSVDRFTGDPGALVDRIAFLRRAGVSIAVDDVGVGAGSMDSVFLLDPDVVKIDRRLVGGASRDERKQRLLHRLVAVAGAFGCELMAEGVEESDDAALLSSMGVTRGQGFLWSHPVGMEQLVGED